MFKKVWNLIVVKGGWKTITAGLIVGGVAVGGFMGYLSPEQQKYILEFAGGLGLLGVAHKLKKLENGG